MKIELEQVAFSYRGGTELFAIPRLEIASGQSVGIVGPSGVGKTTLMGLLAGIRRPTSGKVRVGDAELSAMGERARRRFRNEQIGLVFQDFRLVEYLSAAENLLLPFLVGAGRSITAAVRERMQSLARRLELTHRLQARPGELSQGEQQRVAIGRALMTEPRVILADEPTGNLDEANKHRIKELLLEYGRDHRVTLLMVTHDAQLLKEFDRVIEMGQFRAVASKE